MKVKYVCDCCDVIFDDPEIFEENGLDDLDNLTEAFGESIINEDGQNVYVLSTCSDCITEMAPGREDVMRLYIRPLLH